MNKLDETHGLEAPPVLLLTFNRIETTQRVFEAIRQARPAKLYLASDGPRVSRPEDAVKVAAVREFLTSSVDWPCQVKTLFHECNLGCKDAPIAGISWLFEHEEAGIILEDDCLPHFDFFGFCADALERFKDEDRVYAISGTNIDDFSTVEESYFFSMMGGIWGWASWRRAWMHYRSDIQEEMTSHAWDLISKNLDDKLLAGAVRRALLNGVASMNSHAWDYQWLFRRVLLNKTSVVPTVNLIKNIGFGEDATHTMDASSPHGNREVRALTWPLLHPDCICINKKYDHRYVGYFPLSFVQRGKRKLNKMLSRILKRKEN